MVENNTKNKLLVITRFNTRKYQQISLIGSLIGIVTYIILSGITFPQMKIFGLLTITITPSIVVVPVIAIFCGPIAGFLVGFCGSFLVELIISQQIVAWGTISLAFGALGVIVGIPSYTLNKYADGRQLAKIIGILAIGWLVLLIGFLIGLLVIAQQSLAGTLLYNFLPFFCATGLNLLIITPTVIRFTEVAITFIKNRYTGDIN